MITKTQCNVRELRMPIRFGNDGLRSLLVGIAGLVQRQRLRARLRRDLERLDAHLLHDIGARREELEAEARKPFWRC